MMPSVYLNFQIGFMLIAIDKYPIHTKKNHANIASMNVIDRFG